MTRLLRSIDFCGYIIHSNKEIWRKLNCMSCVSLNIIALGEWANSLRGQCLLVRISKTTSNRPTANAYASHYAYLPGNDSLSSMCIPSLQSLDWRCRELGAKDDIPESAGHTKAVLIVHEVVLKMVLLQLPPVRWQGSVV